MTLIACGLLALGVLAYMISPMLDGSARRLRTERSAGSRRDDLLKKKDFIFSSIRELNIDYNMGKLAAEDHKTLRQEYMNEASDVLDELDRTAVSDLPAFRADNETISCWRLTWRERLLLLFRGHVWLRVWGHQPPVCIEQRSPWK